VTRLLTLLNDEVEAFVTTFSPPKTLHNISDAENIMNDFNVIADTAKTNLNTTLNEVPARLQQSAARQAQELAERQAMQAGRHEEQQVEDTIRTKFNDAKRNILAISVTSSPADATGASASNPMSNFSRRANDTIATFKSEALREQNAFMRQLAANLTNANVSANVATDLEANLTEKLTNFTNRKVGTDGDTGV
jgi:hypothetical protein